METILYNISQVVGVAIIHSMWQGLFIYLFLRLVLLCFHSMSSAAKHNIAMLSLLAATVWFIYTLVGEVRVYQWVELKTSNRDILSALLNLPVHIPHTTTFSSRYFYTIEGFLPYITIIYVAGLLFNAFKLVWSRQKLNDIKQTVSIDIYLMRRVTEFAEKLGIEARISFGLSTLVDVPCVFGYFKPFILLPASIMTSLSTEEVEAILLHELAHIKRNDYLINLAQQAMSVLLFFNPFAQLINRVINHERENSCDDIVIESTQKPIVYAHALLKLEQSRSQVLQVALSATGKKYHLLNRIERIMKTKKQIGNTRHILIAMVVLTASITGLAWLNPAIANGKLSFNKVKPTIITDMFSADTIHKKSANKTAHKSAAVKHTTKPKHSITAYRDDDDGYRSYSDPQLEKLSAEMSKYGDAMNKYYNSAEWKSYQQSMEAYGKKMEAYYNSPEWKKYQEQIEEQGKKIQAYYDSPQWKELAENQQKLGESFSKNWGETAETKEWGEKMGKLGKEIGDYYGSPEFKKYNDDLRKKYGIKSDEYYDDNKDENYRKYQDELKQHIPADIKQKTEELKSLGEKMRSHWNNPEMRRQQKEMRMMGDSMRKMSNNSQLRDAEKQMRELSAQMRTFQNNPEMKKLQEQMRIAGAKMRAYQNNPEMKRIQEQMRIAGRKMRAYMNTPEFKWKMEEMKMRNWNWNYNDDEKPEKPEQPEKPEAPEKPDTTGN